MTPEHEVHTDKMQGLKNMYSDVLMRQIEDWKNVFPDEQIRTIYVGGGTPFQVGSEKLTTLIETIFSTRDCTYLEELTIELNPDPIEEVIAFVQACNRRRSQIYRLRRSFGIQSFDDDRLQTSGRGYTFDQLPNFFRELYNAKQPHVCYNADFIAFGEKEGGQKNNKKTGTGKHHPIFLPRQQDQRSFFDLLLKSHMLDSLSLYTLELFPGSDRYNQQHQAPTISKVKQDRTDDSRAEEFYRLSAKVQQHGYHRHEISNFALAGKRSIHNTIYRTMQSYIGLGIHASSMLPYETVQGSSTLPPLLAEKMHDHIHGLRFQSPKQRKSFEQKQLIDATSIIPLHENERLLEELMLKLRTDQRITDWNKYLPVMEKNREKLLDERLTNEYITYDDGQGRQMTDAGWNIYNSLVTDLLQFARGTSLK